MFCLFHKQATRIKLSSLKQVHYYDTGRVVSQQHYSHSTRLLVGLRVDSGCVRVRNQDKHHDSRCAIHNKCETAETPKRPKMPTRSPQTLRTTMLVASLLCSAQTMGSRRKPVVGIIHSASSTATTTGDDLAVYLGVCLQLGGNVLYNT